MTDNSREQMHSRRQGTERQNGEKETVTNKRDERLDEEIRGQLRKKNEENKKHMSGSRDAEPSGRN